MIANNINGTIRIFSKIPKTFSLKPNVFGYDKLDTSVHYEDGFRELVKPTLEANQYLTTLYFDAENDIYTYEVATYTDEEITKQKEEEEYNLYQQRQSEGLNLYLKYEAKWRLAYLDGLITRESFEELEAVVFPIRLELTTGQLMTAKRILLNIIEKKLSKISLENLLSEIEDSISYLY